MGYWLLSVILLLFVYMRLEASWLEVTTQLVSSRSGLRVAVLSDLHVAFCRIPAERIRRHMAEHQPDLVVFLGDAVDKPAHIPRAARWLQTAANEVPAIAILGNHDHRLFLRHPEQLGRYRQALADAGFRLCINETFHFIVEDRTLRLTILDDDRYGVRELPAKPAESMVVAPCAFPTANHSSTPGDNPPPDENPTAPAPPHLLLTHNPQRLASLPDGYADFAVAGHFHGGQIWMPFGLEFKLFRTEPLGRAGIRRGRHTINGTPSWLSRGVGNVLFPLRLGARPEITFLDF